ncbi:hypothetical protein CUS_7422 [Ruminococcus albus 8]|uniref:Uncharacterized protein n=1 Tax=Ruminococcus albus 8 TaxID=246199 RepID=E9S846_RUMAL|nr:hypothetical protein CUS_7422 [Ruminococcus albus 8]
MFSVITALYAKYYKGRHCVSRICACAVRARSSILKNMTIPLSMRKN